MVNPECNDVTFRTVFLLCATLVDLYVGFNIYSDYVSNGIITKYGIKIEIVPNGINFMQQLH